MNPVNIYARILASIIIVFGVWFWIIPLMSMAELPFLFNVLAFAGAPVIAYFLLKSIFINKNKNK